MTLSDLAKYSMTRRVAQYLCDSWASCSFTFSVWFRAVDQAGCPSVFIARQHTDARYWYSNSVCPSVRLSVRDVPVSDENGWTYRHTFFTYGSPIILVLAASNIFTKFRRGYPLRGAKYRCGINISRFLTNKSLYLANDTRYNP